MSARKIDPVDLFKSIQVRIHENALNLPVESVRIQKTEIEFYLPSPVEIWTEMTVNLQPPGEAHLIDCTGVVVECSDSRQAGYFVSVRFLNLSDQSEEMLHFLTCHL